MGFEAVKGHFTCVERRRQVFWCTQLHLEIILIDCLIVVEALGVIEQIPLYKTTKLFVLFHDRGQKSQVLAPFPL